MKKENTKQGQLSTAVRNLIKIQKFQKVRDHCHYTRKYWEAAQLISNLQYKEESFIPIVAHNWYGSNNYLILPRIAKKNWRVQLTIFWWQYWKVYLFSLRKKYEKENSNGESYNKSYSLRLIDSARFMNASLDFLVNNLSDKVFNRKYLYCMKCKDWRNVSVKIKMWNGVKNVKIVKNCQIFGKKCDIIYEDCKCYFS